jgi:uncharacterized protein with PIN domain
MEQLIEELGCEVAPVTEAVAQRVARADARWGKGVHPAACSMLAASSRARISSPRLRAADPQFQKAHGAPQRRRGLPVRKASIKRAR